jgi:hypothetical protein
MEASPGLVLAVIPTLSQVHRSLLGDPPPDQRV